MAKTAKSKSSGLQLGLKQKLFWQVLIIVFVVIALIVIAITAFLTSETTFRSTVTLLGAGQSKELSSMLDAKIVCDQKVKDKYKNILQSSTLNRLSSRYDDEYGGYKLFYDVSVYRDKHRKSGTRALVYRCHIYNDGDVSETGVLPSGPAPARANRKNNGSFFGF